MESVQYGELYISSLLFAGYMVLLVDHNLQPKPNQTLTIVMLDQKTAHFLKL